MSAQALKKRFLDLGAIDATIKTPSAKSIINYIVISKNDILAVGMGRDSRLKSLMPNYAPKKHTKAFLVACYAGIYGGDSLEFYFIRQETRDQAVALEEALHQEFGQLSLCDYQEPSPSLSQGSSHLWQQLLMNKSNIIVPEKLKGMIDLCSYDGDILYTIFKANPDYGAILNRLFNGHFKINN